MMKTLKQTAAVVSVGVALAGCEKGGGEQGSEPGKLGSVAIYRCLDNGAQGEPLTPSQADLNNSIETAPILPNIPTAAFEEEVESIDPFTGEKGSEVEFLESAPFLNIQTAGDETCYQEEVDGLSEGSKRGLLAAVAENKPLLDAAAKSGALKEIDFRLFDKSRGEYFPDYAQDYPAYVAKVVNEHGIEPQVLYGIDSRDKLPAIDVRTMLRHEVLHSLVNSVDISSFNKIKDDARAQKFADACVAVREIALGQAQEHSDAVVKNLQAIAAEAPADAQAIINGVTASLLDGTFYTLQPKRREYDATESNRLNYGNLPECKTVAPWHIAVRQMEAVGIDYEDINRNESTSTLITDVLQDWDSIIRDQTVYSALREGTYMGDERSKGMGHPYENWDETIVSVLNVAMTYPEQLKAKVEQMPEDHKVAVRSLLEESIEVFAAAEPDLNEITDELKKVASNIS